ncbi:hypothetical protein BsWGS_22858 [Bradybaena similaris]
MDPEDETGSAGQGQNLHDLQNYLSTFNKEIEPGDDVLVNMDVDSGVGDVSELYSSNPDNALQDSADGPVTSQFSSGFYSEQGMLDTPLSDESTHQIQNMGGVDRDAEADIKQEVGSIDLENVQAQLAQLSHGIGDIHTSSIPQSLIMTSLGDNLDPSAGKLIRIVSLGEDGQYLSIADSSQMQMLSQDLGISADALSMSDGALGQMSGLLGTDRGELGYQTITILPSELSQNGDMNYVLIMAPQEAQKDDSQPLAQVVEGLKQETQELSEELVEINGEMKRVLRVIPKKFIAANFGAQLMCDYCDYTSPKRYLLTRHMKSHSDERPHKCKECDRGFKTPASLLNHSNTHTGTRPHKCKTCDAAFTTSGELVRHIRYRHTFEKPHRCPDCDYASVELSKLKRHMRSHTGERPYKCPHCPYASPDTYKLKRHLRIHTGEKPYECDICHARFTQSNSLKAHKLIHSGNKPVFQCGLCPTTCGRKTDLKIHFNKLHSVGSPLECKKCSQTFSDRYSYKQHVRGHDVDKNFKCDQCDFVANTERSFDHHAAVHSDGKKFPCDTCHSSFNLQQTLEKHKHSCQLGVESGMESQSPSSRDKESTKDDGGFSLSSCSSTPVSSSQLVSGPLTSDTLHKNLLQDIKAGKLGDVPQVVIVHPDGSLEEITSKGDRLNLSDIFSALSNNVKDESAHVSREGSQAKGSNDRASSAIADTRKRKNMKQDLSEDEEDDGDDEEEEEDEGPETGETSQCEASTQAELESDSDSADDDSQSLGSPPHFPQVVDKEIQHVAGAMRSESTEDNSTSSNIETISLHSHDASSDILGSLLQNVTSSTASLFSTMPMSAEQTVASNQQFVVVKGYTCLNSDGAQPTLVNVAVDKDSLMKMLASLTNTGDSSMHLLTGDLESSIAISVDSSQTAILPLAQLRLNNFVLGANFENEELNIAQDQDLLRSELISTHCDGSYKDKQCSSSSDNLSLLDSSSKAGTSLLDPNESLLDSSSKAGTSLLDPNESLLDSSSKASTSLLDPNESLLDSSSKTGSRLLDPSESLSDSSSKAGTSLFDDNSKGNKNLLDSVSKADQSLLESSSKTGQSLFESNSKAGTRLLNSDSKTGSSLVVCVTSNTNNVHNVVTTPEPTYSKACIFPAHSVSENMKEEVDTPVCVTSSSLTLINTVLTNEQVREGPVKNINYKTEVKSDFSSQGQVISDSRENCISPGIPSLEQFHSVQGILGDFGTETPVLHMVDMSQMGSQPPRTLPLDEWAASDAGSSQGSLVSPLAVVFDGSHFVSEMISAADVSGSSFSADAQEKLMPLQGKHKGSNRKRTATTDVDQSLVMTGKRVRKTLVKVSM